MNRPATWAIDAMGIEDNSGELFALTRNGEHVISRVTLRDAIRYTRGNLEDGDRVLYNGYEFTSVDWRRS